VKSSWERDPTTLQPRKPPLARTGPPYAARRLLVVCETPHGCVVRSFIVRTWRECVDQWMEHRPIAGAKRHQRRGWRQQPVRTMKRNGWVVALVCPSIGQSRAEGERRSCRHNNRAIRKRRDWRGYRMHALPPVLEALAMQDRVDGGGGKRCALGGRPSRAKIVPPLHACKESKGGDPPKGPRPRRGRKARSSSVHP
jgi:hypothetical protein